MSVVGARWKAKLVLCVSLLQVQASWGAMLLAVRSGQQRWLSAERSEWRANSFAAWRGCRDEECSKSAEPTCQHLSAPVRDVGHACHVSMLRLLEL